MHCHTCGFAVPVSAVTCTGCGSLIGGRPQPVPTYQMAGVTPYPQTHAIHPPPAVSHAAYPPADSHAVYPPAVSHAVYPPGVSRAAYPPAGPQAAYGPPRESHGPGTVLHWVVPVGRSWQSVVAGYLAVFSIIIWILGPAALGMGVWALTRARREKARGTGRAVFAVVAGSSSTLAMMILLLRAMS
jgi:hypothetical protein